MALILREMSRLNRRTLVARSSLPGNLRMTLSYLALLVFSLFALSPILHALAVAGGKAELVPVEDLGLTNAPFVESAGRAALVALAVTLAGVALSSAIGFSLARWRVRPRSDAVVRTPLPQIIPGILVALPLVFVLFRSGLLRAFLWVGAVYLVTALPVFSWQLKRAYERISPSVDEAAAIDGSGDWQIFYSVFLPAVAPALFLTALFSFAVVWNDYFVLGLTTQSPPPASWSLYSLGVLLGALLFGLGLWLFGRARALEPEIS